jgi:membrane protein DedA with SNARE-associated domain
MFVFRLTPFTRGYTSVIAGLLHVKPNIFLPIALFSATIWAAVYVLTGYLIGPYWDLFLQQIDRIKFIMLATFVTILCVRLIFYILRKKRTVRTNTCS